MKRAVLAVAALAALAVGQYIEKYIPLPDSFGSVFYPANIAYNPVAGRLYVPGGRRVLAVDALTGERIGRWPTFYNEGPVCYEPTGDAVYFSSYNEAADRYDLMVYDGTTGALRATIPTGYNYAAGFSPKPVAGKVLCLLGDEESTDELLVVSSTGDSVLARHDVSADSAQAVFVARANRHYIAGYDELLVLDGTTDSLLATVRVEMDVKSVCYNPVNNTVVCGGQGRWLYFVSCSLNVVVDSIWYPWRVTGLAADSVAGRVFAISESRDGLYSLDAATNRLVDSVTDLENPRLVRANPDQGKVYVADYSGLHVFDALSLRRLVQLDDAWPTDLVVGEDGTRVYWTDEYRGLLAIDGVGDTLVLRTPLGWRFAPLCYNPADGRVYGYDGSEHGLLSFDAASGSGLNHRPASPLSAGVCCSLYNKVFVKAYWSIQSYHCAGDTFVPVESITSYYNYYYPMWHDSRNHRVFASDGRDAFLVIDCRTDAVVDRVVLGHKPGKMVADNSRRRLYVSDMTSDANGDSIVTAVDVDGDSVLWRASMSRRLRDLEHNPANNCLYVLGYRTTRDWDMVVLDCSTREVVACFALPMNSPRGLACSPRAGRIYVASDWSYWPDDSLITVVDCGSQSVRGTIHFNGKPVWPYYDAGHDKVYVPIYSYGDSAFAVIDCRTDSVTLVIETPSLDGRTYPPVVGAGDGRIITCSGGEMPWVTVIRDTTPIGVEERSLTLEASRITPAATVVRGLLCLPASSVGRGASSVLLDVTGRKVMNLKAGENDVSRLAPGVYFIRWKGSRVQGVKGSSDKVVIAR